MLQEYAGAAAWIVAAVAPSWRRRARGRLARRRHDERGRAFDGRLVAVCASGLLVLGIGALAFVLLKGS